MFGQGSTVFSPYRRLPGTMAEDLTCEICGAQMVQRQCKISCPNCGFTRDCSDP